MNIQEKKQLPKQSMLQLSQASSKRCKEAFWEHNWAWTTGQSPGGVEFWNHHTSHRRTKNGKKIRGIQCGNDRKFACYINPKWLIGFQPLNEPTIGSTKPTSIERLLCTVQIYALFTMFPCIMLLFLKLTKNNIGLELIKYNKGTSMPQPGGTFSHLYVLQFVCRDRGPWRITTLTGGISRWCLS